MKEATETKTDDGVIAAIDRLTEAVNLQSEALWMICSTIASGSLSERLTPNAQRVLDYSRYALEAYGCECVKSHARALKTAKAAKR